MPINGPSSYIPTVDQFLIHWQEVNLALGSGGALLVGQVNPAGGAPVLKSRTDLDTLRTGLLGARAAVTAESVNLSVKREQVRDLMTGLLGRFNQFAAAVRSRYTGKGFARALPPAPAVGDAPETFLKSIDKAGALWGIINTALGASPLTLGQGTLADPTYLLAAWTAETAALLTNATDINKSEGRLRVVLEVRNDFQEVIAPLLRDYRQAVAGRFSATHALVDSLPRYSPLPGNNPAAPVLTQARWDAAADRAEVVFAPSASGEVVRHELRVCAGPVYAEDLEVIAGSLAAGEPPVFHTTTLLESPGAVISVRVFAVTADGRENDSQTMSIQRPPV